MAELKRAYLFTGDDDVKIEQARRRLAARAARDGAQLETLGGDACTPQAFATALVSPSLLPGARIVLAEDVERWRAADAAPAAAAIAALAPGDIDAIAVLICRRKPLKAIADAVAAAGGETREFKPPAPAELPGWLQSQAGELGVALDPAAARLLVDLVGEPPKKAPASQQWSRKRRLLAELGKLAAYAGAGATIDQSDVRAAAGGEARAELFDLTDQALAGDARGALASAQHLLAAGEPPPRIVALLARTFGQAQTVAALAEAGRAGETAEATGLSPWLVKKLSGPARARGGARLRDALVELARLDRAVKGGSALDDQTELIRALRTIAD